jgi:serine phosphatase RsbU (regulator of sigma subunit)
MLGFVKRSLTLKFLLLYLLFLGIIFLVVGATFIYFQLSHFFFALSFGISAGALTYFSIFYYFYIIDPIKRVGKQTQRLLSGKPYTLIRTKRTDEVGALAHFFNRVTKSVEHVVEAVEQSKRLSFEVNVAKQIQENILPKQVSEIPYLDIVAKTKSAVEIGGDSFDFLNFEKSTYFYIGDATGHGVPAGLIMMMVNALVHAFCAGEVKTNEILVDTNRILFPRIPTTRFMTLSLFRWDHEKQKLTYTGAGHEHIITYSQREKKCLYTRAGGIALGMVKDATPFLREQEIPFEEGDVLLLYSDGVTDGVNEKGERYTLERLIASLGEHGKKDSSDQIFEGLTKDFMNFLGAQTDQPDDMTMMVLKHINQKEGRRHIGLSLRPNNPIDQIWK